jgi:hypothetical protein
VSRRPPNGTIPLGGLAVLAAAADERLATELLADHGSVADAEASSLVRARDLGEDVELGLLRVDRGRHPVDALVGLVADPDWCAVGVAATGTARRLDGPPGPMRVRTVHLVGRDGAWASRWTPLEPLDGVGGAASGGRDSPDRPAGRIDDACRRALGLPTDPPDTSTALLWTLRWLDAVVERASVRATASGRAASGRARATGGGHRPLRWDEVAALHPAVSTGGRGGPGRRCGIPAPEEVARRCLELALRRGWDDLRLACAEGTTAAVEVDAELAGWLDDGAFARWSLGAYPDVDDLRLAVGALLPPSVALAVEVVLARTEDGEP